MVGEKTQDIIEKIQESIKHDDFRQYEPFIRYIRFPFYKHLCPNEKICFDFPLTVLVGENGTNKTSILQAIYGCPSGKSVGEYWFSTNVDTIEEKVVGDDTARPCYIYGYKHSGANKIVEVLMTRILRENDPDYWESSRAKKEYKMEMPKKADFIKAKNKAFTRWDQIKKDVLFQDCKEYVSAYDLLYYHTDFTPSKKQKTKKDFIRNRSKKLEEVIVGDLKTYKYYYERVKSNRHLDIDTINNISKIMGKHYESVQIVEHKLYSHSNGVYSKTIVIKESGLNYSEAFAGSGESRLILLVDEIISAQEKSLILIDEPEISLHPGAQERFKDFLLEQILKKKHQVIISTHSPDLIKGLPSTAIKVLRNLNNESIEVVTNISYQDAFTELGHYEEEGVSIFVEDRLSEYLLKHYLKKRNRYNPNQIKIVHLTGGAESIKTRNIPNAFLEERKKSFYILDGDKNYYPYDGLKIYENSYLNWMDESSCKILEEKIPSCCDEKLDKIVKEMVGCEIKPQLDGSKNSTNASKKVEYFRGFIKYWETNVWFIPYDTPENAIIANIPGNDKEELEGKNFFLCKAQKSLGDVEEVNAEDIFYEQRKAIEGLPKSCDLYTMLDKIFSKILCVEMGE